ncbi:hypothetical protein LPJ63_001889 [Coemansia sp. RSA 2711]|nr:hypothetical protein LPJ63_001889 [Coemansia sp. RSA 2711]
MDDIEDGAQRAAVESLAAQFTVNEIDSDGEVSLEPELSVQEAMVRQIGQLWEQHTNFHGLSDAETASEASDTAELESPKADDEPEKDAYMVRLAVHEQLRMAQSEIQVSLDMVRLLLAAKKQAARKAATELSDQTVLSRHDQREEEPQKELGFAARVGDVEVTVGGMAFPVNMLNTVRVDAAHAVSQAQQQQRREDELKFVLGAKHKQLSEAADTLERSAQRLKQMSHGEARFWRTAFELRRRNWVIMHQRQVPGMQRTVGDRYFVRFGYADAGSSYAADAVAELLRADGSDDDARSGGEGTMDVDDESQPTPVFVPKNDGRAIVASLAVAAQGQQSSMLGTSISYVPPVEAQSAYDRLHQRLLRARCGLFDRELFHRLCREARVLELGSMHTIEPRTDVLMVTLSRDNVGVRFEWSLQEPDQVPVQESASQFVQWQGEFYAGMARVLAAMSQRRAHCVAKTFQLGDGLTSRAALAPAAATGGPLRGRIAPEAFTSVADEAVGGEAAAAVARADLLALSPVLQGVQFAKWQHIISASVQRACAAWRRLVDEPIEVISHLALTHQVPTLDPEERPTGAPADSLAYMVRMRFQGGTVMAFWLDSTGRLYFVKGYYPPMVGVLRHRGSEAAAATAVVGLRQDQSLIRRVFRVVPLSGLGEFRDQLRRELQALVLLRVAAALTRCDRRLEQPGWRMGQWHVHQSQMCVVGELWQGVRQRQVVGVAKWDGDHTSAGGSHLDEPATLAGIGKDEEWNLTLYFGSKHPTAFDIPSSMAGPWVACYPPPAGSTSTVALQTPFEENLLQTLVSAF